MSMLDVHVYAARPPPCCMSTPMLHVHGPAALSCCMSMSMLHVNVHAACQCPCCMSMSMLHVHIHKYMSMSMLHIHVDDECWCLCYMPMLTLHALVKLCIFTYIDFTHVYNIVFIPAVIQGWAWPRWVVNLLRLGCTGREGGDQRWNSWTSFLSIESSLEAWGRL